MGGRNEGSGLLNYHGWAHSQALSWHSYPGGQNVRPIRFWQWRWRMAAESHHNTIPRVWGQISMWTDFICSVSLEGMERRARRPMPKDVVSPGANGGSAPTLKLRPSHPQKLWAYVYFFWGNLELNSEFNFSHTPRLEFSLKFRARVWKGGVLASSSRTPGFDAFRVFVSTRVIMDKYHRTKLDKWCRHPIPSHQPPTLRISIVIVRPRFRQRTVHTVGNDIRRPILNSIVSRPRHRMRPGQQRVNHSGQLCVRV